ncbi:MAG: hypothetical protein ACTHLO_01090 [Pseudolabrys sp.]
MLKLMYVILGLLVFSGTMLMASVAPRSTGDAASLGSADLDIRALERSMNLKALPKHDLDPQVYR